MTTSVLMSTYYRERADFLDLSLKSIWTDQRKKPDEIVLVEDGPLTTELYAVIDEWKQSLGDVLTIVINKENQGLALALNNGLEKAKGDVIIRMDSDDIANPERIEKELAVFEKDETMDVVGSWIAEFIDSPDNVVSIRKVPQDSAEIYRFGKFRNPMNHPSVAFRKQTVLKNGGYKHFWLFEDYCLWARLLKGGCRFYNIQEPLLWFRSSPDMFARRGGMRYALTEIRFQYYMYGIGYISLYNLMRNIAVRLCGRLMPNKLRMLAYRKTMR